MSAPSAGEQAVISAQLALEVAAERRFVHFPSPGTMPAESSQRCDEAEALHGRPGGGGCHHEALPVVGGGRRAGGESRA